MFLTVFLAVLASGAVLFFAVSLALFTTKKRITGLIRSYFTAPDAETPSPFAELVNTIAGVFAVKIVGSIKATVMGMNSVDSRNEKREQKEAIMQANPSLAGLASLLPKSWVKNPEILASIASVFGSRGKQGNGSEDQETTQSIFKL